MLEFNHIRTDATTAFPDSHADKETQMASYIESNPVLGDGWNNCNYNKTPITEPVVTKTPARQIREGFRDNGLLD